MMSRTAAVKLPFGQVAVLGMGVAALTNPDKFLQLVQMSTRFLLSDAAPNGSSMATTMPPTPIVIQTGGSPPSSGKGRTIGFILQLFVGASFCWGSYVVMTNVLPEAAKGMLPVTTTTFNNAVSSLGRAVINLKDTVMEQILGLSKKQEELGEKQDKTHEEVLSVKSNIGDLKEDLRLVQESLDLCHESLSESERRSAHIARGVQLLTRGVSTFLPENDPLLHDLIDFNESSSDEKQFKSPAQLKRLQQVLFSLQQNHTESDAGTLPYATLVADNGSSEDAKVEVEGTVVDDAERCVLEVRALVASVSGTSKK